MTLGKTFRSQKKHVISIVRVGKKKESIEPFLQGE